MARTAAAGFGSLGRACAWAARHCLFGSSWCAAGLIVACLMLPGTCQAADPVKGEASFSAGGGYARLVFTLAEDVESEVVTAGSIIIVRFKRPVDIPIDQLSDAVPDYVNSVRRDPDGSAIRLSLARRVTVNTMTAGERVFVDFLPDSWVGQPPGLPQEVIRQLAERARAAERALRQQRAAQAAKKLAPIRVRTSVQPTFVRFVFEMPDGVGVSSVLNDQKLTLLFNTMLTFDLADAKVAAPPNIASIGQKIDGDASAVEIMLMGDVVVHSFREDKNYVIDVAFQQEEKPSQLRSPVADAAPAKPKSRAAVAVAPVATMPPASEKPAEAAPAAAQAAEIAPPTSELIAQQANIEIKPEAAPAMPPVVEPPKPEPSSGEMPAPLSEPPPKAKLAASRPPLVRRATPARRGPPARPGPASYQPAAADGGRRQHCFGRGEAR